jgi:hypothetical protein
MAAPTLGAAFQRAIEAGRNLGPRGMPVTLERASRVLEDGRVEVLGTLIPVTGAGARGLRAGDMVAVSWQKGKPVVAIRHSARRSGPVTPSPRLTEPLVEELFVAVRPEDGVLDLWFRNFDQCVPLHLERFGIVSPSGGVWSPANDRFAVGGAVPNVSYIMKFRREPYTPFAPGDSAADLLELERTENLSTNTMTVATVQGEALTPAHPNSTALLGASPREFLSYRGGCLDADGNVIVFYVLRARVKVSWAATPVLPPGFGIAFALATMGTIEGELDYPIVIDATNRVVLLSAFDHPALFAGIWPDLVDYNALDPSVGMLVPTTWTPGNSFTRPLSDPPPDTLTITWQCGVSATRTVQHCELVPILVDKPGPGVSAAERVRGFVAWTEYGYPAFAVQTFDLAGNFGYIPPSFPAGEGPNCAVTAPGLTEEAGAFARAPVTGAAVVLFPIRRPTGGLVAAATLDRVVWRAPSLRLFFYGVLNTGGADSPGVVTRFSDGATTQITETLRAAFGQRGVNVLLTDFAYVLDNPAVAQPPGAPSNFFLGAWPFQGATDPALVTPTSTLPEDGELQELAVLAPIPEGVTHPTGAGTYALQVVNSNEVLSAVGRFEELP